MKIQNDNYTRRAKFSLKSGATLEILKCDKGYLLRGENGRYKTEIALTNEAMELVASVAKNKFLLPMIPTSFVREGDLRRKCGKCGSSLKRKWLLRVIGCESPSCPDYWMNANVDLPDTAAQDSASKSNNPAVSG